MGNVALQQVGLSSYIVKQGLIQLISYLYLNVLRGMDAVARHRRCRKVPGNGMSRRRRSAELRTALQDSEYEMNYVETREGHNRDNRRALIDDVLLYFYSTEGAE